MTDAVISLWRTVSIILEFCFWLKSFSYAIYFSFNPSTGVVCHFDQTERTDFSRDMKIWLLTLYTFHFIFLGLSLERLWLTVMTFFTNILVLIMALLFPPSQRDLGFSFFFCKSLVSLPPQSMSNLLKRLQEQVSVELRIWKQCSSLLTINVIYSFPAIASLTFSTLCQVSSLFLCGTEKDHTRGSA